LDQFGSLSKWYYVLLKNSFGKELIK